VEKSRTGREDAQGTILSCTDRPWLRRRRSISRCRVGRIRPSWTGFAARGFDTWCVDLEGYGRSDKHRDVNCDIANGADDLEVATEYIMKARGVKRFLVYGISSGALRAALFAQRRPERVARLALDAFVWTGEGSPTLAERRKKLPSSRRGTGVP